MLINRELFLFKIESTPGVDAVPVAGTDDVFIENPAWSHEGARMVERPGIRGGATDQLKQIWADTMFQVTFSVELKGAGAAYSASVRPELDTLFRICGHSSTLDAGVGVENYKYSLVSDQSTHEYGTFYYYTDGSLFKGIGCQGNVEFSLEAGQRGMANFTIKGHTVTPTDVALPAATYSTVEPPIVKNATFTVDTFSAIISKLSWSPNWEMPAPLDLSASDGFGQVILNKRDVSGSFDPEQELVGTHPFIDRWRTGKAMALATGDIGSVQYIKYNLTAPAISYRSVGPGDKEGIRTNETDFGMHTVTGDDEYILTFD